LEALESAPSSDVDFCRREVLLPALIALSVGDDAFEAEASDSLNPWRI
jgi:hypothetical protein